MNRLAVILLHRTAIIKEWLERSKAKPCLEEQRHLDCGSVERAYWHYGYLVALKDVMSSEL